MLTVSNLIKAERDCSHHIQNLLHDIRFLYCNHKFPNSIFFSIVALEELGKYATYCDYLRKAIDMPDNIEKKLRTSHNFKLQQLIHLDAKRNHLRSDSLKQSYKPSTSIDLLLKRHKDFNKIKKLCLYYDFKCGKSTNVTSHYSHKITKKFLGNFCFGIANLVFVNGSMEFLRQKYGNSNGIIYLNKLDQKDPLYTEMLKVLDSIHPQDESIKQFQSVFYELRLLYDEIYSKQNSNTSNR